MTLEENLAKADAYLKQFQSGPIHHRIGGQDVLSSDGKTFDSFSLGRHVTAGDGGRKGRRKTSMRLAHPPKRPLPIGRQHRARSVAASCTPLPTGLLRVRKRLLSLKPWIPANRCVSCPRRLCALRTTSASLPTARRVRVTGNRCMVTIS